MAAPENTTTAEHVPPELAPAIELGHTPPVTAPLCAMWQGRCGRPAHLIVSATVRIGTHDVPLEWPCCDDLRCILASQSHAAEYGVTHVDSRPITVADLEASTAQMEVAA